MVVARSDWNGRIMSWDGVGHTDENKKKKNTLSETADSILDRIDGSRVKSPGQFLSFLLTVVVAIPWQVLLGVDFATT
jgi:hypothetical protein